MSRITSGLSRPGEEEIVSQAVDGSEMKDAYPVSYLFGRKSKILLDTLGYVSEPEALTEYGHWAELGAADWLPREYQFSVAKPSSVPGQSIPQKNGFILSKLNNTHG